MWVELEESLESGYKNTGQKLRQKLHGRLQEVNVHPAYQNTTNPPLPTTRLTRTMINWSTAMVIDREPVRFSRWIKEAVHNICKEGQHAMNRDEGSYQLLSRLRPLSWHGIFQSCQEPEELSTSFFWWRPLIEVKTSILVINLVVFDELLFTVFVAFLAEKTLLIRTILSVTKNTHKLTS